MPIENKEFPIFIFGGKFRPMSNAPLYRCIYWFGFLTRRGQVSYHLLLFLFKFLLSTYYKEKAACMKRTSWLRDLECQLNDEITFATLRRGSHYRYPRRKYDNWLCLTVEFLPCYGPNNDRVRVSPNIIHSPRMRRKETDASKRGKKKIYWTSHPPTTKGKHECCLNPPFELA